MAWLSLLAAILGLVKVLAQWLHDQRLIDAGTTEVILKSVKDSDDAINRARKAREMVRDAHARDGSAVMQDDGFQRKD